MLVFGEVCNSVSDSQDHLSAYFQLYVSLCVTVLKGRDIKIWNNGRRCISSGSCQFLLVGIYDVEEGGHTLLLLVLYA